jgi:hypothetical protein
LLWSISTAASANAGFSVLCIEQSGKASIEASFGLRCADQVSAASAVRKAPAQVSQTHCSSCIDSSLSPSSSNCVQRAASKMATVAPMAEPVVILHAPILLSAHGVRVPPVQIVSEPVRSDYIVQRQTLVLQQ